MLKGFQNEAEKGLKRGKKGREERENADNQDFFRNFAPAKPVKRAENDRSKVKNLRMNEKKY